MYGLICKYGQQRTWKDITLANLRIRTMDLDLLRRLDLANDLVLGNDLDLVLGNDLVVRTLNGR